MRKLFLFTAIFIVTFSARAQAPWAPYLDPSRAIDWRATGGVSFAIPSAGWAQCVTTACNTLTSAGSSATAAQVNAAIASAPANTYVKLGNVTISMNSCVAWAGHSFVELRGNGPLNTKLVFSGSCGGYVGNTDVAMRASVNFNIQGALTQPGGSNALSITGTIEGGAGVYTQGATHITVSGVGSDKPQVGTLLLMDQADETVPTGNTGWLQCNSNLVPACSANGNGGANGRHIGGVDYEQQQGVIITACTPNCTSPTSYTISPGLYATNLRTSQSPGATWNISSGLCKQCGITGITLDHTTTSVQANFVSSVDIENCYECWFVNNRNIYGGGRAHFSVANSAQSIVKENYLFGSVGTGNGGGYGFDCIQSSDFLIENNIADQLPNFYVGENCAGFTVGYNFSWDSSTRAKGMTQVYFSHDPGSMMDLFEGNWFNGITSDTQHGGSPAITSFRGLYPGQNPVPFDYNCCQNQVPVELQAYERGYNFIANVLGILTCAGGANAGRPADLPAQCPSGTVTGASWQALAYETAAGGSSTPCYNGSIYILGWAQNCGTTDNNLNSETGTEATLMRWGNYDTFNAASRFNSTEASPGASTFIAANFTSSYFNSLAHTFPASFYYDSKPSWWASPYGNPPWPSVGPDVTGGDLSGYGGHAYKNVARLCLENTALDTNYPGTPIINFDASVCYPSGGGTAPIVSLNPSSLSFPPTGIGSTNGVATATLQNTGTASLTISSISITGANAGDFSQTNTCGGTLAINATCTINVTAKPIEAGSLVAAVSISDNAAGSPHTVSLSVQGLPLPAQSLQILTSYLNQRRNNEEATDSAFVSGFAAGKR